MMPEQSLPDRIARLVCRYGSTGEWGPCPYMDVHIYDAARNAVATCVFIQEFNTVNKVMLCYDDGLRNYLLNAGEAGERMLFLVERYIADHFDLYESPDI